MRTKPYDQAFKYLTEQDVESLLILLGDLQPGETATLELLPRELSVAAKLPDQPILVTRGNQQHIAHVEAQTRYEDDVPDLQLDHGLRLWLRYRLPVFSYVLLLTRRTAHTVAKNSGGCRRLAT